jgi:microcystin-dependent protein
MLAGVKRAGRNTRMSGQGECRTMSEPFVGQVIAVSFDFAPQGWLLCNGQLVSVAVYEALYVLIGTTYGGDGTTDFAVPDLRSRTPVCMGTGSGLSPYVLGQMAGTENVTLTPNQIGLHSHPLLTSSQPGSTITPSSSVVLGQGSQPAVHLYSTAAANTTLKAPSIGATGNNTPHENRQPFQAVNYIIAANGIFPPRA